MLFFFCIVAFSTSVFVAELNPLGNRTSNEIAGSPLILLGAAVLSLLLGDIPL